jgi:hypothetical protein
VGLNFFVFGKAFLFEFGEDEFAIYGDFEAATAGRDQGEAFDVLFELVDYFIRHPDGLFFVASSCTIFDFDFGHERLLVGSKW